MLDETQPDFDPAEQKENKMNYSLVVIKSLRWQGAYNAYLNGESYFFYVGNGMKIEDNLDINYNFKNFPTIPEDKPDKDTQPEPHEIPQEKPPEENKVEEPVPAPTTEEQNKEENS
jgi:outer membrane biosynthesis protein TonB